MTAIPEGLQRAQAIGMEAVAAMRETVKHGRPENPVTQLIRAWADATEAALAASQQEVERLRAELVAANEYAQRCTDANTEAERDLETSQQANAAMAKDAARYRFLRQNEIIRTFPISSGMMSRGGTRILADTKDWLPGNFTYVINGKTVDVDAAIDAAITEQAKHE
jgi:microcompartment protein CcmL/EutN